VNVLHLQSTVIKVNVPKRFAPITVNAQKQLSVAMMENVPIVTRKTDLATQVLPVMPQSIFAR
jgi:hypothetical protein